MQVPQSKMACDENRAVPIGISFCAWHLWNVAADAAQRSRDVRRVHPDACTADTLAAVSLSVVAAEAFINEFGYELAEAGNLYREADGADLLGRVGSLLRQLEDDHAKLESKYVLASHMLPGKPFVPGEQPFQDFKKLIRIRNDLTHVKVDGVRPYLEDFMRRGWAHNRPDDEVKLAGWLFQLETPQIACWACRASHATVWDLVSRLRQVPGVLAEMVHRRASCQWETTLGDKRAVGPEE